MEERTATIDYELYQERLVVIEEEYGRLCYDLKKKEKNRIFMYTKKQQLIRQQRESISVLEREKTELALQVQLLESGNLSEQAQQNLDTFVKLLDEMVRLEKQLKDQNEVLETYNNNISKLDKKLKQRNKEVLRAHRIKGRILKSQRNVSFLENRLNDSLHKYNQLQVSNNTLRDEINSLLLTLNSFRRKYNAMKRLIALGKKRLSEIVHSATVSYQTGESVKYKLNGIKERADIDQKKLEEKIKELKILVEQDKELKNFLEFKLKDRTSSSESEESSRNEQIMEEKLQVLRGIMARIQLVSNCKDVSHICKSYIRKEEVNLNLFQKINGLSLEIEDLHREIEEQSSQLETTTRQYKEQSSKDLADKNDIEYNTDKLCTEAQHLEDAVNAKAEELETVKEVMQRIYSFLDHVSFQQVAFSIDEGITDDNVLQYLDATERRITDLIKCIEFMEK